MTTADPVGETMIPVLPILEAIVLETKKLLDVLGEKLIPTLAN
ncbi:MAG: hypothetical protein WBD78_02085 [Methylocella sp.]